MHLLCRAPTLPCTRSAVHPLCCAPALLCTCPAVHLLCRAPALPCTCSAVHPLCRAPALPCTHSAVHPLCRGSAVLCSLAAMPSHAVHWLYRDPAPAMSPRAGGGAPEAAATEAPAPCGPIVLGPAWIDQASRQRVRGYLPGCLTAGRSRSHERTSREPAAGLARTCSARYSAPRARGASPVRLLQPYTS